MINAETSFGVVRFRPLRTGLAAAFVLSLVLCMSALAQDEPPPFESAETLYPDSTLEAAVNTLWKEMKALRASGDVERAGQKLNELRHLKEVLEIKAFTHVSQLLIKRGHDQLRIDDAVSAERSFKQALEFDASAYQAHYGLASAAYQKKHYVNFIAERVKGFFGKYRVFWPTYFSILSVFFLGAVALATSAIVILILLTLKYQSLIRHDLTEALVTAVHPAFAAFMAWVILLLLLVLAFDPYWCALYWGVLVYSYLVRKERVIALAAMIVATLFFPFAGLYTSLLSPAGDDRLNAYVLFSEGVVDDETVSSVIAQAEADPSDFSAKILLANIFNRNGRLREAEKYYSEALELREYAPAFNCLANIHFKLAEYDLAYENWNKAIEAAQRVDPKLAAAPYYNLSIYYVEKYDFRLQKEYNDKARSLDPDLIQSIPVQGGNKVIDTYALGTDQWEYASDRIWTSLRSQGLKPFARPQTLAGLAALVVLFALNKTRRAKGVAVRCLKCGKPYCRKCNPTPKTREYCLQCAHLFIKKDGVSPQMRQDKLKEIKNHLLRGKLQSRLLTIVCPGSQHIIMEKTLTGTLVIAVWFALLWSVVLDGRLPQSPSLFHYAHSGLGFFVCVTSLILLWLGVNLKSFLERG